MRHAKAQRRARVAAWCAAGVLLLALVAGVAAGSGANDVPQRGSGEDARASQGTGASETEGVAGAAGNGSSANTGGSGGAPLPEGEGREVQTCARAEDALLLLDACGSKTVSWDEEQELERTASNLLETYRTRGPCVLAQAGYLDLLGNTWGCVIAGDGWVDVCVVRGAQQASSVRVMRLDRDQVAMELEGVERDGE